MSATVPRRVRLRQWAKRNVVPSPRWLILPVVLIVLAVAIAVAIGAGTPSYSEQAVFKQAPGLFPGNAVEILGVKVGTVTTVTNRRGHVIVTFAVDQTQKVPADVDAQLVSPDLLGEPNLNLTPAYSGGPTLAPHSTIGANRTSIPESTDQLLRQLARTLNAVNPHAVGSLVNNLANDLNGQGENLNHLIAHAAATLQLLANKGDDLGKLNGALAQLTGVLDSRTAEITQLITQYDTVSSTIAANSTQLGDAVTELSSASTQLVTLLTPNLSNLETDIGTVTTVGRTLDRNISSLDTLLSGFQALTAAANKAIDPTHDWLNLNLATSPPATTSFLEGLVRDRLAGICRRVLANNSTGLTTAEDATLSACGNPASGFFNPLLDAIPSILDDGLGTAPAPTAGSLFEKGLSEIPSTPSAGTTAPSTTTTTPPSTTTTTTPSTTTTTPCNLLTDLLGCATKSGSHSAADTSDTPAGVVANSVNFNPLDADALPPMPAVAGLGTPTTHHSWIHHLWHDISDLWSWM